jgi:ribosomal protein L19
MLSLGQANAASRLVSRQALRWMCVEAASVGDGSSISHEAAHATSQRRKHKNAFKRASSLMAEITRDHQERLDIKMKRTRGELPPIQVGDAIELKYTPEITIEDAKPIRGTVIAIKKKGIDSSFTIINYMDEEQFVATYPFNSPLLKSIRIMQKRHS